MGTRREKSRKHSKENPVPPPPSPPPLAQKTKLSDVIFYRKPRAVRESAALEVFTLSTFQRFSALQVESNPIVYISLQVIATFLEFFACVVYFLAVQFPPESSNLVAGSLSQSVTVQQDAASVAAEALGAVRSVRQTISVLEYPFADEYIWIFGMLGIYFAAQFLVLFLASDNRIGIIFSADFLIFLLTTVPMLAMFITSIITAVPSLTIWCPVFLRSWYAWKFTAKMIRHLDFSSAVKEIIAETVLLAAIVINSAGFYQAVEVIDAGHLLTFESTLYFVAVTISTMGYGEVFLIPQSDWSYIIVVVIIFVAMIYLPVMINKFTELASYLRMRNTYSKSLPHVIVVGEFSVPEVKLLFSEFMAGPRKFTPLNLVLVSAHEFDPNIVTLISRPVYRERVTLCVSNTLLNDELNRFKTRSASALFIMSSRAAIGQRGDYDALLRSIAYHRHDRELPQYLTLKRGNHSRVASRTAFAVFERERMKFTLMGMALQLPGFVPMLLNLIKTFESAEKSDCVWYDEYQSGMANSIFTVTCPVSLESRQFKSVALILLLRAGMTAIGVIKARNGEVLLNPDAYRLEAQDELVVFARGTNVFQRLEDGLGGEENEEKKEKKSHPTQRFHSTPFGPSSSGAMDAPLQMIRSSQTQRRKNCFPFQDHVLIIDLSCFQLSPHQCQEEELSAMLFQRQDLMNLLQVYFDNKFQNFVLLSRQDLGEPFAEAWPKHMRPIYHVRGAGTDEASLNRCNVGQAKAVLIFTSLEGESPGGDASLMLVQRMVHQRLRETGREKICPVLVEVDDYGCLPTCEPRFTSDVAAGLGSLSEDYFLSPVFIVGGAICSAMLDPIMYQTYYNPWIPKIIEQLLFNNAHDHKVVSMSVSAVIPDIGRTGFEHTYADLFRLLINSHRIPLGLFRLIDSKEMGENLIGYRYFVTNPAPAAIISGEDIVYIIQAQDQ